MIRWILFGLLLAAGAWWILKDSLKVEEHDPLARTEAYLSDKYQKQLDCEQQQLAEYQEGEQLVRQHVTVPAHCTGPYKQKFTVDYTRCNRPAHVEEQFPVQSDSAECREGGSFVTMAKQYRAAYDEADLVFLGEQVKAGDLAHYKILKVFKGELHKQADGSLLDVVAVKDILDPNQTLAASYEPYYASAPIQRLVFAKWGDEENTFVAIDDSMTTRTRHALRGHIFIDEKNKAHILKEVEELSRFSGNGTFRVLDEFGSWQLELPYQNHKLNGTSRYYAKQGDKMKLINEVAFVEGEVQGPLVFYNSAYGRLEMRCETGSGFRQEQEYAEDGKLTRERILFPDRMTIEKNYSSDGKNIWVTCSGPGQVVYQESYYCDKDK